MRLSIITVLPALVLTAALPAQKTARPSELSEKTFATALAAINPDPTEATWRQIPWYPDLNEAIRVARAKDKPILLWVMNGHPCGMT